MKRVSGRKWESHWAMAVRGAIGGLFAGVIFGVFQMWFLADAGLPAETIIHMIATIVQPDEYFAAGTTSALVGWAVHISLSIIYGALLGFLSTELKSNITRVATGAIYGLGIYVFNFLVLAPAFYPVFSIANQPFEATVHVVYGALITPFIIVWRGNAAAEPPMAPVVEQWRQNQGQPDPAVSTWNPATLR